MNERQRALFFKMVEYDPDPHRIQHLTKVHAYCRIIAESENLPPDQREILETAALVHDIAIPLCLEKYGADTGPLQEQEGPALAQAMLAPLGYDQALIDRVCWLVAHHHTYRIEAIDHQILVEADFIVNAYEGHHTESARRATLENIFETTTGKFIFKTMYNL